MIASSMMLKSSDGLLDADKLQLRRLSPCSDSLHSHDFLELVYVMHGSALHQLGTETYRVSEGDYFIVDFGTCHRYQENDAFEIVNCLFQPEYVDEALVSQRSLASVLDRSRMGAPLEGSRAADRLFHDADGKIRRLFESMEAEYEAKQAGYQEIIRCHLIEILVHAARLATAMAPRSRMHPAAAAMAEYLSEHYAEALSLDVLSARLGYTPQYLSALFHREAGMSLSAYLQRLRVEKSCRRLAATKLPVSVIAQEAGYCDLKHFNAVFRRYAGLSPREYRARVGRPDKTMEELRP